ncbi:MAG TPA: hypothetical protein VFK13_07560 [Gemmatimonadaceae bacterium]|nr:hypothetical protein [Gemmatimonadaceae bacterium]
MRARTRLPRALLLLPLLAACSELFVVPDPARDAALADYVPGIELGMWSRHVEDTRYHLAIEPYVGYVDTTYRALDTFGQLVVSVTSTPIMAGERVPIWSHVERVSLTSTDSVGVRRAEARLRRRLGEPDVKLRHGPIGSHQRRLFWRGRGDRGVTLLMSWDSAAAASPRARAAPAFRADLTFGVTASEAAGDTSSASARSPYWRAQWLYIIARSIAALVIIALFWRTGQSVPHAVGQTLADISAALCITGFASEPVRVAFGLWWILIFVYFVAWEIYRVREVLWPFADDSDVWWRSGWWRPSSLLLWETFANALPLAAGVILVFYALFPADIIIPRL